MQWNNVTKTLGDFASKLQKLQDNSSFVLPPINISSSTIETNRKLAEQNNILDEHNCETKKQTEELIKQTSILDEARELTNKNAEYIRQIAELTIENHKSSVKQFWASTIVSVTALLIAGASLYVSIIQLKK